MRKPSLNLLFVRVVAKRILPSFLLRCGFLCIIITVYLFSNISEPLAQSNSKLESVRDLVVIKESDENCKTFVIDHSNNLYQRRSKCDVKEISYSKFEKVAIKGTLRLRRITALAYSKGFLYLGDSRLNKVFSLNVESLELEDVFESLEIKNPISLAVSDSGILAIGQDEPDQVLIYDTKKPNDKPSILPIKKKRDVYRLKFFKNDLLVFNRDKNTPSIYYCENVDELGSKTEIAITEIELDEQLSKLLDSSFDFTKEKGRDIAYVGDYLFLTNGDSLWAWKIATDSSDIKKTISSGRYSYDQINNEWERIASDEEGIKLKFKERFTPIVGQHNTSNFSRLIDLEDILIGADNKRLKISFNKLKPFVFSIKGATSERNNSLVKLYKDFYDLGVLPEREIKTSKEYKSFRSLLTEENILIDENSKARNKQDKSYEKALNEILCGINKDLNKWKCKESPPYPLSQTIKRGFGKSQALVIPNIKLVEKSEIQPVKLNGRTVQSVLEDTFQNENLNRYTDAYLMRINSTYLRTFDYEMTSRGFIIRNSPLPNSVISPGATKELKPGSTIRLMGDWKETNHSGCNITEDKIRLKRDKGLYKTFYVPSADLRYLPGTYTLSELKSMSRRFNKSGVVNLEIKLTSPKIAYISRNTLKSEIDQCLTENVPNKEYFVADVLTADKVEYTLRRSNGSIISFTQKDIERYSLNGTPDPSKQTSLIVDETMVVAYRPIHLNGQPIYLDEKAASGYQQMSDSYLAPPKQFRWVSTVNSIKPGSSQDIRSKNSGTLQLPGKSWNLNLLVDSNLVDLQKKLILRNIIENLPINLIQRKQFSNTIPQSVTSTESLKDITMEEVKKNRDELFEAVKFPKDYVSEPKGEPAIGLIESKNEVNLFHPDLFLTENIDDFDDFDDFESDSETSPVESEPLRQTVWLNTNVRKHEQIKRETKPISEIPIRSLPRNTFCSQCPDHPLGVAGLLASNNPNIKGFVPDAPIYFIDTNKDLFDQIDNAVHHRVLVYNLSQKFSSADTNIDLMRNTIKNFPDRLFIIAAGNSPDITYPSVWARQLSNVLVVSSIDNKGNLINGRACGEGSQKNFNYGASFVYLVAPGCNIFTNVSENSYAAGSGTSFSVPIVTAIASLLWRKNVNSPENIIARLLYTSDWNPSYKGKVFGGSLNAGRALKNINSGVIEFNHNGLVKTEILFKFRNKDIKITNRAEAQLIDINDPQNVLRPPGKLKSQDILRIERNDINGGSYRVFYIHKESDSNKNPTLRVILNARLAGELKFKGFSVSDPSDVGERRDLDISNVVDYTSAVTRLNLDSTIKFR